MKHLKPFACAAIFLLIIGFKSKADIIYDDFAIQNGYAFSMGNGQEIGNEISINPNLWSLTNFAIEYFTPNAILPPSVGIDARFYFNDGTPTNGYPSPGTVFYDSGWFYGLIGAALNPFEVVTYNSSDLYGSSLPGSINMPNGFLMSADFTFTITFTNLVGGNQIWLPLATNTPPGGSRSGGGLGPSGENQYISYGDYWLHDASGAWSLRSTNIAAANLVVNFSGTPEPSTAGLAALGGTFLLGFRVTDNFQIVEALKHIVRFNVSRFGARSWRRFGAEKPLRRGFGSRIRVKHFPAH